MFTNRCREVTKLGITIIISIWHCAADASATFQCDRPNLDLYLGAWSFSEIRLKFSVLWFKIVSTDHSEILRKSRQYCCRDVCNILLRWTEYVMNKNITKFHQISNSIEISLVGRTPGPVFYLLIGVSSDYAQPITGHVTEVTCPVIGRARPELTLGKRQHTGPGVKKHYSLKT